METTENLVYENRLTFQQFEDLIVTALEGGSNYWYDIREIPKGKANEEPLSTFLAKKIWEGEEVKIYDLEESDLEDDEVEPLGVINLEKVKAGLVLAAEKQPHNLSNLLGENFDADDADVLFQLMVLGEVTFG